VLDLVLKTAPADEPVMLDEAKHHLRYVSGDQDDLIGAYLASATAYLDGPSGVLGRALVRQSWTLYLDHFPWRRPHLSPVSFLRRGHRRHWAAIRLPLPPLISVDSITYVDTDGNQQPLDVGQYTVRDGEIAEVEPAYGACWPATRCQPRAVALDFTCGYGDPSDVPKPLQAAILLQAADLFENRSTQLLTERAAFAESDMFKRLIFPYRVART
jgi:hypothetical protein